MSDIISNLAVLAVYHNDKKNYIESFVPFITALIKEKKYEYIDLKQIRTDFEKKFGLAIPYHPMNGIMSVVCQKGFLLRKNHTYIPNFSKISKCDFESNSTKQRRQFEKIIKEFIKFCNDEYGVSIDEQASREAFLSFLKKHDLHILSATKKESILPQYKHPDAEKKENIYLISKFIIKINASEPDLFAFIVDIAIGHIVASAILYSSEIINVSNKKIKIKIYFDTPFILGLLGVDGTPLQDTCLELIKNLKEQGANLFIFSHNYEEIKGILNNCKHMIDSPNYEADLAPRILVHFKQKGYKKFDIETFEIQIIPTLKKNNINCTDAPPPNQDNQYHIEEKKLFDIIDDYYQQNDRSYNKGDKKYTIQKDVDSIVAINKLRKNILPSQIRDTKFIFVTPNHTLARLNRKFEKDYLSGSFFVPACVTDVFIGTVFWINSPIKLLALNQKKLIADCYAALKPNREMRVMIADEAQKLLSSDRINNNQYILLRESEVVEGIVMDRIQGNLDKFDPEKTIFDVLEDFDEIVERKYLEEKTAHDETKEEKNYLKNIVKRFFDILAHITTTIIYVLLFFITAIGIYYTQIQTYISNEIFKKILGIISFIFLILTFFAPKLKYKIIKQKVKICLIRIFVKKDLS